MLVGAHLSSAGNFVRAAENAVALGLDCVQHFTRNPRGGRQRRVAEPEATRYREVRSAHGPGVVVMHAPYTVNLASTESRVREFARSTLVEDMERCRFLDVPYLVVHPGSHGGRGMDRAAELVVEGLSEVLSAAEGNREYPMLLLEMMSGAGNEFGSTPGELATVFDAMGWPDRLGLCIDTCHSFARGYPLDRPRGLDSYLGEIDDLLGLVRLKVVHLNDSALPSGSLRDRHARMGRGKIGERGLRGIINHPILRDLPFILEVPVDSEEDYADEAALVRSWGEPG